MTEKVQRFVDRYFETLNASASAVYAGFSAKTARQQAYDMLERPDVQEYLQNLRAQKQEETGITQAWIIERFKHISDACVTATPVMAFDPIDKCMVQKRDDEGNGVYEFDSSGANKATEMLGKIIGVFEADNRQKKTDVQLFSFDPLTNADTSNDSTTEDSGS